jgi:hypothetical protein
VSIPTAWPFVGDFTDVADESALEAPDDAARDAALELAESRAAGVAGCAD